MVKSFNDNAIGERFLTLEKRIDVLASAVYDIDARLSALFEQVGTYPQTAHDAEQIRVALRAMRDCLAQFDL